MKIIAQIFSFAGHPLIVITYILAFLLLVNPYSFGVNQFSDQLPLLAVIFLYTFFLPVMATVLMKTLGFVSSLSLDTRKERIAPYVVTGTLYLWTFQTLLHNNQVPVIFKVALLGVIIGLFLTFFINNFSKISSHAAGAGALAGIVFIAMVSYFAHPVYLKMPGNNILEVSTSVLWMGVILFAGLIGTSRLVLRKHEPVDVYGGFLVGFSTQFIALNVLT